MTAAPAEAEIALLVRPLPPGKLGVMLFLASEAMFFVGLLGAYIVLRSNQSALFSHHALALNKPLGIFNTVILTLSSATMAFTVKAARGNNKVKQVGWLILTLLLACTFVGIKSAEYANKFHHHTIVVMNHADGRTYAYDGHETAQTTDTITLHGYRMELLPNVPFDIHLMNGQDIVGGSAESNFAINRADISQDQVYGPSKNMFFACYFTLTGVHLLHLIGGMIALLLLLPQAMRGKTFQAITEYVALYWYFVDVIWLILFALLYFS